MTDIHGNLLTGPQLALSKIGHYNFMLTRCEYQQWRNTWKPDDWMNIVGTLADIRPSIEALNIDTAAISEICNAGYSLTPQELPKLAKLPDDLWKAANRSIAEFTAKATGASISPGLGEDANPSTEAMAAMATLRSDEQKSIFRYLLHNRPPDKSSREASKGLKETLRINASHTKIAKMRNDFPEHLGPRQTSDDVEDDRQRHAARSKGL
jgi:hypothetical protein